MLGSKLFRVPVISLVIFLTCSFGQTLSVDSREYAVDIISRNGLRVKFPFYRDCKSLDPEVREQVGINIALISKFLATLLSFHS